MTTAIAGFTCTTTRTALVALATAAAAVAAGMSTRPIYRCCRLAPVGGALQVAATDGQVGILALDSTIAAAGDAVLVVAASLAEVLSDSTSEQVSLAVEGGDSPQLRITLSDGTFALPVTVGEELPPVPGYPADGGLVSLPAERLEALLRDTAWATEQGGLAGVLSGVQVEVAAQRLTLVATDGKVLIERTHTDPAIADPTGTGGSRTAILPTSMVRATITALAAAAGATADLACPGTNACVRLVAGTRQVVITGRTITGTYPAYRQAFAMPADAPTITVDRDAVRSALRRLGAVMDGRSPAVVVEVLRDDQVRLHNLNTAAGTAQVTVGATVTGSVRRLALNAAYLAQVLAHRPTGPVTWRVGRSLTSTHAHGVDLIMPVTLP